MTEEMKQSLESRNRRIIDAVLARERQRCPGAISLIGIGGSFCSGDIYEKSDLDLMIVINDDSGWQVSSCFILGTVAHDIYCTPWSSLERMAEYPDPYVTKLLDIRMVYAATSEDQARYDSLRERMQSILAAPLSLEELGRAEEFLHRAEREYASVMLAEDFGTCRYAAAGMIYYLEFALYLLNKEYVHRGVKRIPEEIASFTLLPEDYPALSDALVRAGTPEQIHEAATELLRSVRACFARVSAGLGDRKPLTTDALRGTYEEIFSNWRNKMEHAAQIGSPYLSLMTAMSCQNFYDEMAGEYDIPQIDLMSRIHADDLSGAAAAFDEAMEEYLEAYHRLGLPVRRYHTIEEFEADYLKPLQQEGELV